MNDEIVKNVTDKLDLALERGKQLIEDEEVQQRIQDLKNVAEETVRKHPIKSIVVGLAVGFLVGKALSGDDE
ncbi:MAG: hypothetical protein ABJ387_13235 [Balneola sp.]|jgi:ElaB/YqjD/DUF883 family membrane-anchored ribosome-binding protein|uniref:hypothetical protein n=1 Tax=Balneola sp. EhC07 TaxID=1849360 RepID=UPI0007F429FD|nr:hypothetical protein [Balneola sp. EhC07]OAN62070.1 hypothetical protein A8B79_03770 [Balneola sp. EhC07]